MLSAVATYPARRALKLCVLSLSFLLASPALAQLTENESRQLLLEQKTRQSDSDSERLEVNDDERRDLEGYDGTGQATDDYGGKKGGGADVADDDYSGKKGYEGYDGYNGYNGKKGYEDDDDDPGLPSCEPDYALGDNPCVDGCGHAPVPNAFNPNAAEAELQQVPSPCKDYKCLCADSGCLMSWDIGCIKFYMQCQTQTQVCGSLAEAPFAVQDFNIGSSCTIAPTTANVEWCFPKATPPSPAPFGPEGDDDGYGGYGYSDDDYGKKGGKGDDSMTSDDDSGKKGGKGDDSMTSDDDSGKKGGKGDDSMTSDDDSGKKGKGKGDDSMTSEDDSGKKGKGKGDDSMTSDDDSGKKGKGKGDDSMTSDDDSGKKGKGKGNGSAPFAPFAEAAPRPSPAPDSEYGYGKPRVSEESIYGLP